MPFGTAASPGAEKRGFRDGFIVGSDLPFRDSAGRLFATVGIEGWPSKGHGFAGNCGSGVLFRTKDCSPGRWAAVRDSGVCRGGKAGFPGRFHGRKWDFGWSFRGSGFRAVALETTVRCGGGHSPGIGGSGGAFPDKELQVGGGFAIWDSGVSWAEKWSFRGDFMAGRGDFCCSGAVGSGREGALGMVWGLLFPAVRIDGGSGSQGGVVLPGAVPGVLFRTKACSPGLRRFLGGKAGFEPLWAVNFGREVALGMVWGRLFGAVGISGV